jgi:hypothetical protein
MMSDAGGRKFMVSYAKELFYLGEAIGSVSILSEVETDPTTEGAYFINTSLRVLRNVFSPAVASSV